MNWEEKAEEHRGCACTSYPAAPGLTLCQKQKCRSDIWTSPDSNNQICAECSPLCEPFTKESLV